MNRAGREAAVEAVPTRSINESGPEQDCIPLPVLVGSQVVRMDIVDAPPRLPHDGVCRCEACRATHLVDWAGHFLP